VLGEVLSLDSDKHGVGNGGGFVRVDRHGLGGSNPKSAILFCIEFE
jgi:hypothetical protein